MTTNQMTAMSYLKKKKGRLSRQQYRTVKGQILSGDVDGALRGLQKLELRRKQQEGSDGGAAQTKHPM